MTAMKSIAIICNRYPSVLTPTRQVFVQRLVGAMADQGVECTVICPIPVNQYLRNFSSLPPETEERSPKGNRVRVFFPRYVSLGQRPLPGVGNTVHVTTRLFTSAVRKVLRRIPRPEALYGHFFAPAGVCAARLGRELGLKAFAAYGESTPWSIHNFGLDRMRRELDSISGIVSVSSANKAVLVDLGIVPESKIGVFPNGVQTAFFYPRDRTLARRLFQFPEKAFIAAYVGQFTERKGVMRVAEAVRGLHEVSVAFAGAGKEVPSIENCIHLGKVKPDQMPEFLSAADVFVLPTLNEGCPNAVVEAMACGLPVVSSDMPFNYDILNQQNSIMVDPTDVSAIRSAIVALRDDANMRYRMAGAALSRARQLSIDERAANVLQWMRA